MDVDNKDLTTPVSRVLTEKGIPHREFRHPGRIDSLEQAARERDQSPEQVVRSILFRLSGEEFVMVLMGGPQQIDWRVLRRYLEQTRLTTASQDEVTQVTGYERGAVAPFGLPTPMRILVDESAVAPEEISIGSGVRGIAVILRSADLLRALEGAERVKVAKNEDE